MTRTEHPANEKLIGKDLTLVHWRFFYRWRGRNPSSVMDKCWKEFVSTLEDSVKWAGGWKKSSVEKRLECPSSRTSSSRLACIDGENKESNETWSLESRTMQDTFYIQTGRSKRGENSLTDVGELITAKWEPKNRGNTFLGEAVCLWLEVERLDSAEAEKLSRELLETWSGEENWRVEAVKLKYGFLILPETGQAVCVMLVWQNEAANISASYLLHWILPQLWTALLKKPILMQMFDDIRPIINELEIKLQEQVNQTRINPHHIEFLEQTTETLSDLQVELASYLGEGEDYLHTLKVNVENIEKLLEDEIWKEKKQQLSLLVLFPLQQMDEQFETDMRYAKIEQTRADQVLQSITLLVQVRSAKWERLLTILFGLLALFGAAEMFPEIVGKNDGEGISWYWRLAIILFLAMAVYSISWLWRRKAKKNKRTQKLASTQAKQLKPRSAEANISQFKQKQGRMQER